MDYGRLLNRTWHLLWEHKFLILFGILVALGGSAGSGGISSGSRSLSRLDPNWQLPVPPEWDESPVLPTQGFDLPAVPAYLALVLVGVALIVALVVWIVSTLSRGALIAGAGAADAGRGTSFGEAFALAWQKGWTLLGIGIFPAIPAAILALGAVGAAAMVMWVPPVINGMDPAPGLRNVWIVMGGLTCVALPSALVLNLLRTLAERACMLEGCTVFAAYGRGFRVLVDHLGSAVILFLIQVGIGIAMGLVLLLPALCCVLWPLHLLAQGIAAAFFSTMWTLAWRRWAGLEPAADRSLAA